MPLCKQLEPISHNLQLLLLLLLLLWINDPDDKMDEVAVDDSFLLNSILNTWCFLPP